MCHRLILIRHAQIGSQYTGRYLGSTNVPLSEAGCRQAGKLAGVLGKLRPEKIFCSPLLRARQTVEAITKEFCPIVEFDDNLREIGFGRWEGLTFEEIADRDPAGVRQWAAGGIDFTFPDGERTNHFIERIELALDRIIKDPIPIIAVISHGGVIRFMICALLGLEYEKYLLFNVKPAALTRIDLFEGNRGVLVGFNQRWDWEDD